jgi:hypothetical protein
MIIDRKNRIMYMIYYHLQKLREVKLVTSGGHPINGEMVPSRPNNTVNSTKIDGLAVETCVK